jgi:ribulose-phosphate 3-epimerase
MAHRCVAMPLSVHLMLTHPDKYLKRFADAGAHSLLIHIEADCNVPEALRAIRALGVRPGITLNPGTPAESIFPVLDAVDEVLCMTVHPGYGGQAFIRDVLPKIRQVRDRIGQSGRDVTLMVDGGINEETVAECARCGANAFVAGTNVFRAPDMAGQVALLRRKGAEAYRD